MGGITGTVRAGGGATAAVNGPRAAVPEEAVEAGEAVSLALLIVLLLCWPMVARPGRGCREYI